MKKLICVASALPLKPILSDLEMVIKSNVGFNAKTEYSNNLIFFISDDGQYDLKSLIESLNSDFYYDLKLFESSPIFEDSMISEYQKYIEELYNFFIDNKAYYFTEADLVKNHKETEIIKKNILKSFYDNYEMCNTIKVFLECDMNTTKAANNLYIHRNTMINRLDKFISVTGYNIKKFNDAFIIYQII